MTGPDDHDRPSPHDLLATAKRDGRSGRTAEVRGRRLRAVLTDKSRRPMLAALAVAAILVVVGAALLNAAGVATYHGVPCGDLHEWYREQQAGLNDLPDGFPSLGTAMHRCDAIVGVRFRWGFTLVLLGGLAAWLAVMGRSRPLRREHLVVACGFALALLLLSVPVGRTEDSTPAASCGSVLWPGRKPSGDAACSAQLAHRSGWGGVVAAGTFLVAAAVRRSKLD